MTKVIAVMNQKGGVGKTTTCVNLGAALVKKAFKVLLIDLDPMGSMTGWLLGTGVDNDANPGGWDFLCGRTSLREVVKRSDELGLDFIAAPGELASSENPADRLLQGQITPYTLKERLGNEVRQYHFVIIDCPPSSGLLARNALLASDGILIPIQTETIPLRSGVKFIEWLQNFKREHKNLADIVGILPCMFDSRTRLSKRILEAMRQSENLGPLVFKTVISKSVRLAESSERGKSIFGSASASKGAGDYASLALEVVERTDMPFPSAPRWAPDETASQESAKATSVAVDDASSDPAEPVYQETGSISFGNKGVDAQEDSR